MLKIKVLINNIKDKTTINKGLELVKQSFASISFPLEITVEDINKKFTSVSFNNKAIGSGIQVKPEEILALPSVTGTDDIAFLLFNNNDVNPKPLNPTQNPIKKGKTTPCQMCEQWYGFTYAEVFRDFFIHEICHSLYFLQNNVKGDLTHNQQQFPQWQQKQNIDYYLWLLSTLNPKTSILPTVVLKRKKDNGVETIGDLSYGSFKSKTLERPWKDNKPNISMIPEGKYLCKWTYSLRFLKYTYELQNVPGRSGIRIHSGNFFFDVEGCILLGSDLTDINSDGQLDVTDSRKTISSFETLMGKNDFILEIKPPTAK